MRYQQIIFFIAATCAIHFSVQAQEDAPLTQQYQNMVENSETFEKYKVIPITKVNEFGTVLSDSINTLKQKVSSAKSAQESAEQASISAKAEMKDIKSELEEAKSRVDEMPLFGMEMTKTSYNVVMWSIVAVLLAGVIIVYIMFLNSFRLTKQAKKDKQIVDQELEDLRKRSHEKQVKIKRELQTALNKLDEYKR